MIFPHKTGADHLSRTSWQPFQWQGAGSLDSTNNLPSTSTCILNPLATLIVRETCRLPPASCFLLPAHSTHHWLAGRSRARLALPRDLAPSSNVGRKSVLPFYCPIGACPPPRSALVNLHNHLVEITSAPDFESCPRTRAHSSA